MKCTCKTCKGEGVIEIECDDCDGKGSRTILFSDIELEKHHDFYDDLKPLRDDIDRVSSQCAKMKELKPEHSASYDAQMQSTIRKINESADAITRGELFV